MAATEVRWKLIPFFSGYSVSDRGKVRSTKRGKPRILKPHSVNRGDREKSYLRVTLCQDGKKKHRRVHRLVALAFVSRPKGTNTVDHVDGNTFNNVATNLEWVTGVENTKRAWRNGLMRRSVGASGRVTMTKKQKVLARSPAKSMRDIIKGLQDIEHEFREFADGLGRPVVGPENLRTEVLSDGDAKEKGQGKEAKAPRRRRQDNEE